jgi:hypothetical protein
MNQEESLISYKPVKLDSYIKYCISCDPSQQINQRLLIHMIHLEN